MATEERIRTAILGAGIGAKHLDGLLRNNDIFEVRSICDLDADRGRALAARADNCEATSDLGHVLADPEIDLVSVCLPPRLHSSVSIEALAAGKHVVCEKPFALSLTDAERMIDAARDASRHITPVFQYRYGLGFRQLLHLIEAGIAGAPLVATAETHWNRGADYYAVPWRGTWNGDGGGCMVTHAIHAHDLLTHALGPVARVTAMTATRVNAIAVDDCAAATFAFASGALATSSVTLGAAEETSRLRFCFENVTVESGGTAYHPAAGPWRFTARSPMSQNDVDAATAAVPNEPESFAGFYRELGRSLRGKPSRVVEAEAGRQATELITALYRSARAGVAVELPVTPDDDKDDGRMPARNDAGPA